MSARMFAVAAAVAVAAILTPSLTLLAKDDPAAIRAAREEVRKKFKDAKKIPSADLSYYVDTTKMKDSRWQFSDTAEPAGVDDPKPMFHASFPSGNATDASASIDLYVWRSPHSKTEGGGRSVFSTTFKNWGQTVKVSDIKDMAAGYYEDFIAGATDLRKEQCKSPKKVSIGVAEWFGCAVGSFKDEGDSAAVRMRRDWYVWGQTGSTGAFTWLARFTTSAKFIDNEDWLLKIPDLMKNMKELSDPKLK